MIRCHPKTFLVPLTQTVKLILPILILAIATAGFARHSSRSHKSEGTARTNHEWGDQVFTPEHLRGNYHAA